MRLPRYERYKASDVQWLGAIPEHWSVVPLRHLTSCLDGKRIPLNSEQRAERPGNVPYWGANCVMDYVETSLFDEDLVLLGEDGAPFFDRLRPVAFFSQGPVWPNNHVHVLRPLGGCAGQFLVHALNTTNFGAFIDGSTRDKLTQGEMNRIPIALPPPAEQSAIATFLDHETAKIDALIAEQEKLIALLAEKRQATISHAVTRGLNPDAPMKDSGVPRLGEVPAHWEVKRLRRVASAVQTGGTPTAEAPAEDIDGGLDWYTPGDFGLELRLDDAFKRISAAVATSGEAKVFPAGSILVVSIGATLGKVGLTTRAASANQQINALTLPESCCGAFFAYSLTAKVEVMRFLSNASTIGIMNQEKTKEIVVAVPPLAEQYEIADFLDLETARFAALEVEAIRAVTLLKERRTALIAAAVTGQIDVRGFAENAAA